MFVLRALWYDILKKVISQETANLPLIPILHPRHNLYDPQNLLARDTSLVKVSCKYVLYFVSNHVDKQTNKHNLEHNLLLQKWKIIKMLQSDHFMLYFNCTWLFYKGE